MSNRSGESMEAAVQSLEGRRIKEIFKKSEIVAALHTTLSSKRGDYFRKRLLHRLGEGGDPNLFESLRNEAGIQEYERHIHKLLKFELIECVPQEGKKVYIRTPYGEKSVNALRGLERDIGSVEARRIYEASLGSYSIQLFLRVYADPREADFATRKIKYNPREVGQLTYFLPRSVDGLSAVDKLNEAGLLSYEEDGNIYAPAIILRGFYKYLTKLYEILVKGDLFYR